MVLRIRSIYCPGGVTGSAQVFNPISVNVMRGPSMGGWLLSRRDGAIVAWHEVPGTSPPQKSRPVG
jgi:hypothetical protein